MLKFVDLPTLNVYDLCLLILSADLSVQLGNWTTRLMSNACTPVVGICLLMWHVLMPAALQFFIGMRVNAND